MKYKLLVLDVDGTLLNEEKAISKRTLSALLKVQQMGVRIVLASGRPTYGLMSIAKTLELGLYGGFILSYNGCQIIDARNGQVLFERRINPEMLPYIEKKAVKNNFALFTYHDNTLLTNTPDNTHVKEEAELNGLEIIEESEFSTAIDFAPCKCMLVSDDADALIGLESHWKKRLDGVLDVFRSEDYFLEVVPCSVDKANTLAVLMEQLGVTRDEVMAIGDGVCDVAMIQLAGMGVAMGNSVDSVKICADYTTDTNENDGVAQAVEKLILADIRATKIPLGKSGYPIHLYSRRPRRSYHASRPPYPSTLWHPSWWSHISACRNCSRTWFHDSMSTRRDSRRDAGERQSHFVGTRRRYGAGRGHHRSQRTLFARLERGCLYFNQQACLYRPCGEQRDEEALKEAECDTYRTAVFPS